MFSLEPWKIRNKWILHLPTFRSFVGTCLLVCAQVSAWGPVLPALGTLLQHVWSQRSGDSASADDPPRAPG